MIQAQQFAEPALLALQLRQQQKKLYILSTQNDSFRQQHESFLHKMHQDAQQIIKLTTRVLELQSQQQNLAKANRELQSKYVLADMGLRQKTKEYCDLHNYLYADNKRAGSDLNAIEMEFCSQIHELHHSTDAQIIQNLEQSLKHKNKALICLHRQISQLSMQLLSSSYQYQEQIQQLKQKLRHQQDKEEIDLNKTATEDGPKLTQLCALVQLEQLSLQLQLHKNEVSSLRNQCQQYKHELIDLKKQQLVLTQQKDKQQHQLEQLHSAFDKYSQSQIKQTQHFSSQIRQSLPASDYQAGDPKTWNHPHSSDLHDLMEQNEVLQDKLTKLEIENQNLDFVSTTVFQKLKQIIIKYIPILQKQFRYFDFKKAEIQFIDDKSQGLNKALSNLNAKHTSLLSEHNVLRRKVNALQLEIKQLNGTITESQGTAVTLRQERNILLIALEAFQNNEGNIEQIEAQDIAQDQPEMGSNNQEHIVQHEVEQTVQKRKIILLQNTVQLLQNERIDLLSKIKQYHLKIHEIKAELALSQFLRQHNTYTIENPQINNFHSIFKLIELNPPIAQPQPFSSQQSFAVIRRQLKAVCLGLGDERKLIVQESQRRLIQVQRRYYEKFSQVTGLQQTELALRVQLEKARSQKAVREEREWESQRQIAIELIEQQQKEVAMGHNDNNMINESTICNIIELLKKYEKQFNKFVNIYEQTITKAAQPHSLPNQHAIISQQNYIQVQSSLFSYTQLHEQLSSGVQQLSKVMLQKEQKFEIQISFYKSKLQQQEQRNGQLRVRLQNALQAVARTGQNRATVDQRGSVASLQSVNTMLSMIGYKNNEISELKQARQLISKQLKLRTQQLSALKDMERDDARFYSGEQRVLSELIQGDNVVGVMESVLELISRQI